MYNPSASRDTSRVLSSSHRPRSGQSATPGFVNVNARQFHLQHSELYVLYITAFVATFGAVELTVAPSDATFPPLLLWLVALIAILLAFLGDISVCRQQCRYILTIPEVDITNVLRQEKFVPGDDCSMCTRAARNTHRRRFAARVTFSLAHVDDTPLGSSAWRTRQRGCRLLPRGSASGMGGVGSISSRRRRLAPGAVDSPFHAGPIVSPCPPDSLDAAGLAPLGVEPLGRDGNRCPDSLGEAACRVLSSIQRWRIGSARTNVAGSNPAHLAAAENVAIMSLSPVSSLYERC